MVDLELPAGNTSAGEQSGTSANIHSTIITPVLAAQLSAGFPSRSVTIPAPISAQPAQISSQVTVA